MGLYDIRQMQWTAKVAKGTLFQATLLGFIFVSCAGDFNKDQDKKDKAGQAAAQDAQSQNTSGVGGTVEGESVVNGNGNNGSGNGSGGASGNGSGGGGNNRNPGGGGSGNQPVPKLGLNDTWTETVDNKSWNHNKSEPQSWDGRSRELKEVLRIFDDNQFCKYQIKTSTDNLKIPNNITSISISDQYCKSSVGGKCQQKETCTTEKIAALASGIYIGSEGVKKICVSVSCSGTGTQSITRTESQIWTNSKVEVPEQIVKRTDYSCQMQLKKGDVVADFKNPCDVSKKRSISFSRSQRILENHKIAGAVPHQSANGAKSSISAKGIPVNGEIVSLPATCSSAGRSSLKISISRSICNGSSINYEHFDTGKIDLSSPDNGKYAVEAAQASLVYEFSGVVSTNIPVCPASTKRNYRLPKDSNCYVQLSANESDGVISGKGTCTPTFDWYNASTKLNESVHIKEFNFTCNAPKDFDFGIISGH